jgi:DNA-binding MarR family transcriptional regulator
MASPSGKPSEKTAKESGEVLACAALRESKILAGPAETPAVPAGSYELRVLQSLRRIIRAVEIHSKKLAHSYNITGPQLGCLAAVNEKGPLTTTKLAQAVYLSPSTIVGIVDRLEEKNLVIRERGSKDRRQVQIGLTEAGEQLLGRAPSALQDTLADALKSLPELEQVSITLALEKIVDIMEAGKIEVSPVLETGSLVLSPVGQASSKKP